MPRYKSRLPSSTIHHNHTVTFHHLNTFNMVSLRSGKRASDNGNTSLEPEKKKIKASSTAKPKDPAKAEAKDDTPLKPTPADQTPNPKREEPDTNSASDVKDEESRPKTPVGETAASSRNEKTPGRVGPIKEIDMNIDFDISPFKGPKGKRVRKTPQEKNEEYRQRARETPGHCFHDLYVCYDKGPNGSPTYDEAGFELDYKKVADWMAPKPYNKAKMVNGMEKHMQRVKEETLKMIDLFWEPGAIPREGHQDTNHWKDRVSKDLGVPWHKVGVAEFEKWDKLGFPKAKKEEYEKYQNPSEKERDRMMKLMSGASLRK